MGKETKYRIISGINIQAPWTTLLLDGKKTIETRTYPIPKHYIDQELVIIETPGKKGKFRSRMIGLIVFGESFRYESSTEFYADFSRHFVTKESAWAWHNTKPKWGWPVQVVKQFKKAIPLEKRGGIKFTKNIKIKI